MPTRWPGRSVRSPARPSSTSAHTPVPTRLSPPPTVSRATANIRGYFTANPREYFELRGILAPIGDVQLQRNVTVLPPALASAYDEFMAG